MWQIFPYVELRVNQASARLNLVTDNGGGGKRCSFDVTRRGLPVTRIGLHVYSKFTLQVATRDGMGSGSFVGPCVSTYRSEYEMPTIRFQDSLFIFHSKFICAFLDSSIPQQFVFLVIKHTRLHSSKRCPFYAI